MHFEGHAPVLTWNEIREKAIDVVTLDFTVTTEQLIQILQNLALFAPFFDDLTPSELKRLTEINHELYQHLRSLPVESDERAKITDQLRLTLKTLWNVPGVPAVIFRNLPNIHEADSKQERNTRRSKPPQGW